MKITQGPLGSLKEWVGGFTEPKFLAKNRAVISDSASVRPVEAPYGISPLLMESG